MTPRPYRSRARSEAAEQTHRRIVAAAAEVLRERGAAGFSLESVGRAAGVTRLTVYNQFGSRRALLEALFDETAASAGLHRLAEAMSEPDPMAALRRVIEIFCAFWASDLPSIAGLHASAGADAEFAASVRERNERRRRLLSVIVERLQARGAVAADKAKDLIDLLFVLTSFPVYAPLATDREPPGVCALLQAAAEDAVRRAGPGALEDA